MPDNALSYAGQFPTTLWSVVLKAGNSSTATAAGAMAALCEAYWYPVYAYIRRRGFDPDAARDLTQAFFTRIIEKDYFRSVSPDKGRFRAFLLTATKHFLYNEHDRKVAQKRGGRVMILPLEFDTAEGRYRLEPAHDTTPETIFQRRWALTLIDRSLRSLRERTAHPHFEHLQQFLSGEADRGEYAPVAHTLGVSESALKVAVHRLRKQYREILRAEIAQTVDGPQEVEGEIRFLLAVLSSTSGAM